MSQTRPESVVTTAAYLLFYRRRSNDPLGPPYLQKMVEEVHNADSEPVSRSTSPAGDGHRLGGSSLNGSSSDSYTVGMNHHSATDGLAGGLQARSDNQLVRYVADEDEGIALNDEEMLPDYSAVQGPPGYNGDQGWSFKRLDDEQAGPQNSDDEIPYDARSDKNAVGSDLSAGLSDRLLEDFGDDMAAHTGTPFGISQSPTPDDDEEAALHITAPSFEDDDEPVAEVRLDLEKPDDLFDKAD